MDPLGLATLAFMALVFAHLMGKRVPGYEDQPCYDCRQTIHWAGTCWIHLVNGQPSWPSYSYAEWLAHIKAGETTREWPIPHIALPDRTLWPS